MKIQFNTDKTIIGNEEHEDYFTKWVTDAIKRYESRLSRVEVHISDENGSKKGVDDIRCLLEARIEGRQPLVVTCDADTVEKSVSGAIDKLKSSLETTLGRLQNH
jgi:ribosome-associated translation inhibitor RaiA